ncbi:MAG: hotdog domain-containing protein [Propionibacteriaceae bacterium]
MTDMTGTTVVHRRYVGYNYAHYAGNLVDGAFSVALFGDVATELCIVTDGDEGLFVGYSDISFKAPVYAGDILEITATLVRQGRRSREMEFTSVVVCRGAAYLTAEQRIAAGLTEESSESASVKLAEPIVAVTACGTVVVPQAKS